MFGRMGLLTALLFVVFMLGRVIQKLSDTLSLPNVANISARRRTGFDENDALDWTEKNASSVLQVGVMVAM